MRTVWIAEATGAKRRSAEFRTFGMGAALALLLTGYLLQLLGVLRPDSPALVAAGAVLGLLCEALMLWRAPGLARRLSRTQLTRPVRQLLRDALLLGGLGRLGVLLPRDFGDAGYSGHVGRPEPYAALLLIALLGCWAAHCLCQGVAGKVRRSRRLPFVTRNIDTAGLRLSPAPPALFGRQGGVRLFAVSAFVTAAATVTVATRDPRWCALTAAACCAVLLAGTGHLAVRLLPGRRPAGEKEALAWLDTWLAEYRPTVGMYFSGGTSTAYQANMWLSTLEQLAGERPIVVLRERFMVRRIDATDVPVLCLPKVADLMRLEHSTLSVLLHPANSGKTSQVLRIPTIKHAFVNHGESDKLSSCNPYAKAYDQVWVAGPAARERYRLADIGVADEDVVEVGRPQLAPIRPFAGPPAPGGFTTVLYAPTWEGWTNGQTNTSVALAGERIVAALLADRKVRLLYKPHPMTGSVSPDVAGADRRIRSLIAEANIRRRAEHASEGPVSDAGVRDVDGEAAASAEMARHAAELAALTGSGRRRPGGTGRRGRASGTGRGGGAGADEVERMLVQSAPASAQASAHASAHASAVGRALAAWEESYWRSVPPWEHRIVTGSRPRIHACFNEADLLISDVSSVVSDYLSSGKPYAVVNTSGLTEREFRVGFPTVRAATILSAMAEEIPAVLASVRDADRDRLGPARARLREYLLGPAEPPSITRFTRAVRALRAEAEAHRERSVLLRQAEEEAVRPVEVEERDGAPQDRQLLADALGDEEGV
jgi:hypothetical protein